MKLLKIDEKEKYIEVIAETFDDLWHLEKIIEVGDKIQAKTDRKIKPTNSNEQAYRVTMNIKIKVENIDFDKNIIMLRFNGTIENGTPAELIEIGAHHSIEVGLGTKIKINKEIWKNFLIERLENAVRDSNKPKILIIAIDDEKADFALLKPYTLERKGNILSNRKGKRMESDYVVENYYKKILEKIKEINAEKIVIAGPGFTKENFQKWVNEKEKINALYGNINSTGETGLQEILKTNLIEKIEKQHQLTFESKLVEKALEQIGKNQKITYGKKNVKEAVELFAVEEIIVSDKLMTTDEREEIEPILETAEKNGAKVHIISSEHESGKQLIALTGIIAFLRYEIK